MKGNNLETRAENAAPCWGSYNFTSNSILALWEWLNQLWKRLIQNGLQWTPRRPRGRLSDGFCNRQVPHCGPNNRAYLLASDLLGPPPSSATHPPPPQPRGPPGSSSQSALWFSPFGCSWKNFKRGQKGFYKFDWQSKTCLPFAQKCMHSIPCLHKRLINFQRYLSEVPLFSPRGNFNQIQTPITNCFKKKSCFRCSFLFSFRWRIARSLSASTGTPTVGLFLVSSLSDWIYEFLCLAMLPKKKIKMKYNMNGRDGQWTQVSMSVA